MEYKKITEVEMIEEPSENAAVLAEDDGKLRRVPFKKVGGGSGLPSVSAPHQMLVTDADGKTVWEERTHYKEKGALYIIPESTAIYYEEYKGTHRYIAEGLTIDVNRLIEVWTDPSKPLEVVATVSGEEYKTQMVVQNGLSNIGIGDESFSSVPFYVHLDAQEGFAEFVCAVQFDSVTFDVCKITDLYHEIDASYIPWASATNRGAVSYESVVSYLTKERSPLNAVVGATTLGYANEYFAALFPSLIYEGKEYFSFGGAAGWTAPGDEGRITVLSFNCIDTVSKTICKLLLTFNGEDDAALLASVEIK